MKLFLPVNPEQKKAKELEETKEGEEPASTIGLDFLLETNEVVLIDDKLSIKEAGILEADGKLEVEIVIKLTIDVLGKGKDYAASLEVSPDAPLQ